MIDTRDKRSSAIMVGLPFRMQFPSPDSSLANVLDRMHMAYLYRVIISGVDRWVASLADSRWVVEIADSRWAANLSDARWVLK